MFLDGHREETILRLALAQINVRVGDLDGNGKKILTAVSQAEAKGAGIVLFPELALTGYPPEDLCLRPDFIEASNDVIQEIAARINGITALVGFISKNIDDDRPHNSMAFISNGQVQDVYNKSLLPNYGVFDERRYFSPGTECAVYKMTVGGTEIKIGATICEDVWRTGGPVAQESQDGAGIILTANSSPYHQLKWKERQAVLSDTAKRNGVFIAYCNLVGGQDELVFDGHSMVFGPDGALLAQATQFEEDLLLVDIPEADIVVAGETPMTPEVRKVTGLKSCRIMDMGEVGKPMSRIDRPDVPLLGADEEVYRALVLGVKDYVRKNGFSQVLIGLSGGIDSALTAAIAVDALGSENVVGVTMPSRFSSQGSLNDARELATLLGIEIRDIPIEQAHSAMLSTLKDEFSGTDTGLAEENIQARLRGSILMSLSNKFGWMVLTTGNKSEMACGYATLYGDMAGGFAVIKDVPKTLVYRLSRWRNSIGRVIPEDSITKPPSAELRPDQKDSDSLPDYEQLDPILAGYVQEDKSLADLINEGHDADLVNRIVTLVDLAEYKRRQAPPGIKITPRSFGKDRRMPITNRFSP